MSVFDAAVAALAADPNLGADAIYTPQGEAAMAVRIVLSRAEDVYGAGSGMVTTGWMAMLPTAQVPDRPLRHETLSVGERDYTIESAEADETGASWRLMLRG